MEIALQYQIINHLKLEKWKQQLKNADALMQQVQLPFATVVTTAPVPDVAVVATPALKTIGRSAASPNL